MPYNGFWLCGRRGFESTKVCSLTNVQESKNVHFSRLPRLRKTNVIGRFILSFICRVYKQILLFQLDGRWQNLSLSRLLQNHIALKLFANQNCQMQCVRKWVF